MGSRTCAYDASIDEPGEWHGTHPSEFVLNRHPKHDGLGIFEWRCPHPPLGQDHGDEEYCVFHTETEVSADQQQEELLKALDDAGNGPWNDRPEHRGQFVGATFGAIDLSDETIAAEDHDIRFDHAVFRGKEEEDLRFSRTTFVTRGGNLSFQNAEFTTEGGYVGFQDAEFTAEDGDVWFQDAEFTSKDDGHVRFEGAEFTTEGRGYVGFEDAEFTAKEGGYVWFVGTEFTAEDGYVGFEGAEFTTKDDGDGNVIFGNATLTDANFRYVDFDEADLRGAELTGTDLRQANIEDVSVNGSTTCKRLNEGYGTNHITGKSLPLHRRQLHRMFQFGKRLSKGSEFDPQRWDATAMAYHDLKTVFSGHGLVGKARAMHIRERRARSLEPKAASGWVNFGRYLGSLPSRFFTGYGI